MKKSVFLINYEKINLANNISEFSLFILKNERYGIYKKKYYNTLFFLINAMEILDKYDTYHEDMNILNDEEYQNILNSIKQILNIEYYGYTE